MKKCVCLVLSIAMLIGVAMIAPISTSAAETDSEPVGFAIRTSAPVSGGAGWQYYCAPINNYPLSPYNNGNCTWYAYGRAYEAWGTDPGLGSAGDAGNWYSWAANHGYSVGSTPRAGSIICWGGHVAFVESVSGDSVTFTESNYQFSSDNYYPRWRSYTTTHPWTYTSGFQGYIYLGSNDTTAPTISNARVENVSGSSFTIKCDLYDNVGVTRVWLNIYGPNGTTNGYAVAASNGTFSHTIYTSDYAGAGLYSVHIYAFDAAGHETATSVGNIQAINDTSAPTITNTRAVNISGSEFTITCELNDNVNVTRVYVIVYSPNGAQNNGYDVPASNGTFSHTIKTAKYGGAGTYAIHLYAFDAAGNQAPCAINNIVAKDDSISPTITNAKAVNLSSSEFTITCELSDNINVTRVYVIVYSPNGAQNNGYDVPASNGTFSHTIKTAKYGGAGVYAIHLYAFDSAGNQAPCAINDIAAFQAAESVEINKTKTTINVGESENLTATVLPSDTYDKTITWTSSNTNVATVSDGTVTAKAAGTAIISATTSNGKTATCTVTVNNPEPEKTIKDGVYYENGVAKNPGLVKVGNDIYCTTTGGKLVYGDKEIFSSRTNGLLPPGTYHFDVVTGKLYKDNVIIDDVYYKEGAPKNVGIVKVAGSYYVTTTKGVITKNAENKYIASTRTNGLVAIGYYDFGADGKMILKNGIIGGKYYKDGKATNVGLFEYEIDGVTSIYCTTTGGVILKDVTNKYIYGSRTNGLAPAGYHSFDADGKMIN